MNQEHFYNPDYQLRTIGDYIKTYLSASALEEFVTN